MIALIRERMYYPQLTRAPDEGRIAKSEKRLHGPGLEPGTPAVLRQCHNQLDHPRWTVTLCSERPKYACPITPALPI